MTCSRSLSKLMMLSLVTVVPAEIWVSEANAEVVAIVPTEHTVTAARTDAMIFVLMVFFL